MFEDDPEWAEHYVQTLRRSREREQFPQEPPSYGLDRTDFIMYHDKKSITLRDFEDILGWYESGKAMGVDFDEIQNSDIDEGLEYPLSEKDTRIREVRIENKFRLKLVEEHFWRIINGV